jgi:DHA1 family inner membrane transport protein
LTALAIGAFGIGTTEFTPMGLLPVIAEGMDVSIPSAGMLVTAYAIGVMLGAPIMTLLFSRFGKRGALIALMAIFTLGNLLSALAPGYATLLALAPDHQPQPRCLFRPGCGGGCQRSATRNRPAPSPPCSWA